MAAPSLHSSTGKEWDFRFVLWATVFAAIAVLGVPVIMLFFASIRGPAEFLPIESGARWTLENFRYMYGSSVLYTDILPATLIFAAGSVALSSTIALMLAWYVERTDLRWPVLTRMLILAPLAIPTPALAIAWIQLLGPNAGWINEAIRWAISWDGPSGPFNVFSMTGLIWCQGMAGVPVAYLLLAPAVRGLSGLMEEASYTSGVTPRRTFVSIGLPMIVPFLAGPLLIMFLVALEQVDFPYILGPTADINVLGTRILWEVANSVGLPNMGGVAALALLMFVLAIAGLLACNRFTRAMQNRSTSFSAHRRSNTWLPKWMTRTMRAVLIGYALVTLVLPLVVLGWNSADLALHGVSGFEYVLGDQRFWKAATNTLLVAGSAAAIATAIGLCIALCASVDGNRVSVLLDRFSVSSIAVPSLIAAFGVAVLALSVPVGLYGTVGLLILAYSFRIALPTRMARAGLAQVGSSLQEAASVAGAGWFQIQRKIVIPLMMPSVLAAAAVLFIVGLKEFTIPLMLYSPDNVVLSVLLLQLQQAGDLAAAAAAGVLMTIVALTGVAGLVFADRWLARRRGEQ